jgi:hypothetical protein
MRIIPTHRCTLRALVAVVPVVAALAFPASSLAQATRTWVSGVGDDANPCSRTAPCKTFAGAISKTAPGGEINVLDPGGFGAVTITKSITISSDGFTGGVLVSGTNGIVISAGASDRVTLIGLDFDGLNTGLAGVKILQAGNVRIDHSRIFGFSTAGVFLQPSSGVSRLAISNSEIYNNAGDGLLVAPTGSGKGKATLIDDQFQNNNCGVVAASYGAAGGSGAACGTTAGSGAGNQATITTFETTIADHTANSDSAGIFSQGATATNRIGHDNILGNSFGLRAVNGGAITSFGNNSVIGNVVDGSPTTPNATTTSARHRRHRHRKSRRQQAVRR